MSDHHIDQAAYDAAFGKLSDALQTLQELHVKALPDNLTKEELYVGSLAFVVGDVLSSVSCALHAANIDQKVLGDIIAEGREQAREHDELHHKGETKDLG